MENQSNEPKPHLLSVVAARVVSGMADRPGTWDFEKAFQPFFRLMDLQSRAAENELSVTTTAAEEARLLYSLKRGFDLQNAITELEKEIAKLKLL